MFTLLTFWAFLHRAHLPVQWTDSTFPPQRAPRRGEPQPGVNAVPEVTVRSSMIPAALTPGETLVPPIRDQREPAFPPPWASRLGSRFTARHLWTALTPTVASYSLRSYRDLTGFG